MIRDSSSESMITACPHHTICWGIRCPFWLKSLLFSSSAGLPLGMGVTASDFSVHKSAPWNFYPNFEQHYRNRTWVVAKNVRSIGIQGVKGAIGHIGERVQMESITTATRSIMLQRAYENARRAQCWRVHTGYEGSRAANEWVQNGRWQGFGCVVPSCRSRTHDVVRADA